VQWVDAKSVEEAQNPADILNEFDGLLIPGGFGEQGYEGMIQTVKYARENNVPYLGLCYGMQIAVSEFARHVCAYDQACSAEVDSETPHPVINIIETQKDTLKEKGYGGTMRLGAYASVIIPGTTIYDIYEKTGRIKTDSVLVEGFKKDPNQQFRLGVLEETDVAIVERHRHRYEVNPEYAEALEKAGLVFSGHHIRQDGTKLMEFIEIPDHTCFIATQGHPEFTSRLGNPNPMFLKFVESAADGDR
jgi:CTP synthase